MAENGTREAGPDPWYLWLAVTNNLYSLGACFSETANYSNSAADTKHSRKHTSKTFAIFTTECTKVYRSIFYAVGFSPEHVGQTFSTPKGKGQGKTVPVFHGLGTFTEKAQ